MRPHEGNHPDRQQQSGFEGLSSRRYGRHGHQLFLVQSGLEPDDWKPMSIVGTGVKEIRVKDTAGIFRAIYLATRPEGVYVLHCFQKKTPQTAQRDIELARQRLKEVLR